MGNHFSFVSTEQERKKKSRKCWMSCLMTKILPRLFLSPTLHIMKLLYHQERVPFIDPSLPRRKVWEKLSPSATVGAHCIFKSSHQNSIHEKIMNTTKWKRDCLTWQLACYLIYTSPPLFVLKFHPSTSSTHEKSFGSISSHLIMRGTFFKH